MKKKLSVIVFLSLLVISFSAASAQALPTVSLNLLNNNIVTGDLFDVEVWANGDGIEEELLAFGFDVATSGNFFSYNGYTIESGFDDASDPFNPNNVAGDVFLGITDENILLAMLSFTALSDGTDTLKVFGSMDDFSGLFYEISGYNIDASLEITVNPVPEPGTIFLLAAGMIGLLIAKRRITI